MNGLVLFKRYTWSLDTLELSVLIVFLFFITIGNVAIPLWPSVRMKLTFPKLVGDLESSKTPKTSEFNNKAQNTLHWGVLGVIGKFLKLRCPKWPRIGHLDICSSSYGQKKGKLTVWLLMTKSQELTSFRCPILECDMALKSSWGELQLWFRPCCN
jgi:hypothetical protein